MSVIIKDMDKADRCADCQLLQTYQEHPFASVEMWCGVTDERIDNMQMVLPTCPIIADRKTENCSEKPNNCETFDKDINVRSKDCETCKHYKLACELFSEICKYEPTTQTETQNSNLTFEKDECAKEYEELGLKELKELIEADRKTEPTISKMEQVEDEPQTETEIAKAIVHKMIDDAVIAEDAYPDLRQKMHDAVDEYEPQTMERAKAEAVAMLLKSKDESRTDCPWK